MNNFRAVGKPEKSKVKVRGKPVVRERFEPIGRAATAEEIRAAANAKVKLFRDKGIDGGVYVNLKLKNAIVNTRRRKIQKWIPGRWTSFNEPVEVADYMEYDFGDADVHGALFDAFELLYVRSAPKAGGCEELKSKKKQDTHNDCGWNCLNELGPLNPWETPALLKKFLNLDRDDKIPMSAWARIDKITAKKSKVKINVSGDYTYTSTETCIMELNIKLVNGHYRIRDDRKKIRGIKVKRRHPVFYVREDEKYTIYNGKEVQVITTDEWKEIRNEKFDGKYILLPMSQRPDKITKEVKTIEEQWDDWLEMARLIENRSLGVINPFKTGRDTKTALDLFYRWTKHIIPEPILQAEANWITNCSHGPLISCVKGYKGPAYQYDVCSEYGYVMSQNRNLFPIKKGEFMKVTEFQDLKSGCHIYRCIIEYNKDKHVLFRWNKKNYYTMTDILVAQKLGLKIELIQDDQPNLLFWKRTSCVHGGQLFGRFVKFLFDLKKSNIDGAKQILTASWGALTQRNKLKETVKDDGPEWHLKEDREIVTMCSYGQEQLHISYVKNDDQYETDYARIKPFILAYGRQMTSNIMEPFYDKVLRVHTDGILFSEEVYPTQIRKHNAKLGDLKYEGFCKHVRIEHCNSIKGKFE